MGLFSGFNPVKAITRAVGIPDKFSKPLQYTFAPFTVPTSLAFQGAAKLLGGRMLQGRGAQTLHDQGAQPGSYGYMQPYQPQYGGFYTNPEPLASYYQGGQQWGSLTPSTIYSQPQYQTYPVYSAAPPQPRDRTWEDLATAAALFL